METVESQDYETGQRVFDASQARAKKHKQPSPQEMALRRCAPEMLALEAQYRKDKAQAWAKCQKQQAASLGKYHAQLDALEAALRTTRAKMLTTPAPKAVQPAPLTPTPQWATDLQGIDWVYIAGTQDRYYLDPDRDAAFQASLEQ